MNSIVLPEATTRRERMRREGTLVKRGVILNGVGLLVALGLLVPVAAPQTAPQAVAQEERLPVRPGVTAFYTGLVEVDYQRVRHNVPEYRTVQAERYLKKREIQLLQQLVEEDSLARRNRNLITDLMRNAELITNVERVIGALPDQKVLLVLGRPRTVG